MSPEESAPDVAVWLATSDRITVLTGAGISTDSGIPDYRGPEGVWTKNPKAEKISHIDHYLADPEVRRLAWQRRLSSPAWDATPNSGHEAVRRLHATGRVLAVVTQNIDELHQKSGIPDADVVEVHGSMHRSICWECGDRRPMSETLERVRAGEDDPRCLQCGGIVKSDTISFGQSLVPEVILRAMTSAESCELLLVIGSTLSVSPVNQMVPRARSAGARVVIINGETTGMDHFASAVVRGRIADVLPPLVP